MRTSDFLNTLDYLVRKRLAWKPHEVVVNHPWLLLRAGKSQYTLYTGPSVDLSVLGLVRVPGFAPPNPRFRDILTRIASPFPMPSRRPYHTMCLPTRNRCSPTHSAPCGPSPRSSLWGFSWSTPARRSALKT